MELDTLYNIFLMSYTHNLTVIGFSTYFKLIRDTLPLYHKGVVAGCFKRVREFFIDGFSIVMYHGGLSMHKFLCMDNFTTKGITYCLMSKTYTKDRNSDCKVLD